MGVSRPSPWIRATISLLAFIAVLVAAVRWADMPNIRYQQFPHLYQVIYGMQGRFDVAVTVPSRLASMVDPHLVAERLAETDGRTVVVVELGHYFPVSASTT